MVVLNVFSTLSTRLGKIKGRSPVKASKRNFFRKSKHVFKTYCLLTLDVKDLEKAKTTVLLHITESQEILALVLKILK